MRRKNLSRRAPGSADTMSSLMFSARHTMSSSELMMRVGRATEPTHSMGLFCSKYAWLVGVRVSEG